jgi:hypothetical protein
MEYFHYNAGSVSKHDIEEAVDDPFPVATAKPWY